MWLLLLLIRGLMIFSFISISFCDVSVNKEVSMLTDGKDLDTEGSGSSPINDITSDDEDFYPGGFGKPGSSPITESSGDGSFDRSDADTSTKGHVSSPKVTSDTFGDDEDDTEDDEDDDDDDDEGSGDLIHSSSKGVTNGGSDFSFSTKETITDDDHFKPPDDTKPDTTFTHPDESEDKDADDDDNDDDNDDEDNDKSSDNFPSVIETSTKQYKPNHDVDHEDHDQDENTLRNDISLLGRKQDTRPVSFFAQPSMLAALIGGTVVILLCAILLAMFIIYRIRRKDEASYICEPNLTSPVISHYGKGSSNKFFDPE